MRCSRPMGQAQPRACGSTLPGAPGRGSDHDHSCVAAKPGDSQSSGFFVSEREKMEQLKYNVNLRTHDVPEMLHKARLMEALQRGESRYPIHRKLRFAA